MCAAALCWSVVGGQEESTPPYDANMPDSVSFPVDPAAILNETDELMHRPFASATYTYHAGVFDVHANDTTRDGSTMVSNGVFASPRSSSPCRSSRTSGRWWTAGSP